MDNNKKLRKKIDTFVDCMPNPFLVLKGTGFDVNFYRK